MNVPDFSIKIHTFISVNKNVIHVKRPTINDPSLYMQQMLMGSILSWDTSSFWISWKSVQQTNQPTHKRSNGENKNFLVEMQFKFTRLVVQLCRMSQRIHLWSLLVKFAFGGLIGCYSAPTFACHSLTLTWKVSCLYKLHHRLFMFMYPIRVSGQNKEALFERHKVVVADLCRFIQEGAGIPLRQCNDVTQSLHILFSLLCSRPLFVGF